MQKAGQPLPTFESFVSGPKPTNESSKPSLITFRFERVHAIGSTMDTLTEESTQVLNASIMMADYSKAIEKLKKDLPKIAEALETLTDEISTSGGPAGEPIKSVDIWREKVVTKLECFGRDMTGEAYVLIEGKMPLDADSKHLQPVIWKHLQKFGVDGKFEPAGNRFSVKLYFFNPLRQYS